MEAKTIKKVHCLFEQCGTFKNEFIKLGIPAEDYDIQNNFNQTDHVVDLLQEIDRAYDNLTRQDIVRFYRPESRPGARLLPMHLFLRPFTNAILYE